MLIGRSLIACVAVAALLTAGASTASAATVTTDGTTVTYTAASGKLNSLSVSDAGGGAIRIVTTNADPITVFTGCTENNPGFNYTCPGSNIVMSTGDLEDIVSAISLAAGQTSTTDLGDGDDRLTDGPGNDTVAGGAGNDLFGAGQTGTDSYSGGAGDDQFIFPNGPDEVRGGDGTDSVIYLGVEYLGAALPVDRMFSLDDQANDNRAGEGTNVHSDVEELRNYYTEIREAGIFGGYVGFFGTPEGKSTLVGSAAVNTVQGGDNSDDLDGGLNNDLLVGGEGDDVLRSVDGYADRLVCGPGADTAIADTLDVISDTCETVTRQDAGNANEDKAPTVTFDTPAADAALTTGVNRLTASASDDRGVAQVLFMDDTRIICTDTSAPYTCDYTPSGEDVGQNTLAVMAVDTSQQTATAMRATTVPRFLPTITSKVSPKRDRTAPYTFTTTGTVTLPATVSPELGCTGTVTVQIKVRSRTVSTRRAKLSKSCTYRSKVAFGSRLRAKRLKVTARFLGNAVVLPRTAKAVRPRLR